MDVPKDIHTRFLAAAEATKQGSAQVRRTELFLRAFEAAYTELPEIIAAADEGQQLDSPLFGVRPVEVSTGPQVFIRLQIRPTVTQYQTLTGLADAHNMPFARLTRIVLDWYLPPLRGRASRREEQVA